MNNKMLVAVFIFSSVNVVNAMDNVEAQLHADNTVKAIVESSKKSATKDIFEVLRLAAQGMSSQDKKWCERCTELFTKINVDAAPDADFDETLWEKRHSWDALMMINGCVSPFEQAVKSADAEEEFDAIRAANDAAAMDLKSTLKKISEILE